MNKKQKRKNIRYTSITEFDKKKIFFDINTEDFFEFIISNEYVTSAFKSFAIQAYFSGIKKTKATSIR